MTCIFAGYVTEGSGDAQGQQIVVRRFVIHKKIMWNVVHFEICNKYKPGEGEGGGGMPNKIIKGNHSIILFVHIEQFGKDQFTSSNLNVAKISVGNLSKSS